MQNRGLMILCHSCLTVVIFATSLAFFLLKELFVPLTHNLPCFEYPFISNATHDFFF